MTNAIDNFVDQHIALKSSLPGSGLDWLDARRQSAIDAFAETGFPTPRDEAWKYTEVRPITNKHFSLENAAVEGIDEVDISSFSDVDSYRIVMNNGHFNASLSNFPAVNTGVIVDSLSNRFSTDAESVKSLLNRIRRDDTDSFTSLNQAFMQDGIVIQAGAGAELDKPLEIIHIAAGERSAAQPHVIIDAENNTKLQVIEQFVSSEDVATFANSVTDVALADGAEVDYYLVQMASNKSYQVSQLQAHQSEGSRFSCRTITLGGALVRNNIRTHLAAPGAHCDMLGLFSLAGRQHVDNHTTMVHGAPECTSRELYKGVLDQRSRGVFHGRIKVEKDAQKTDAEQNNNTLLLSRDAEIDTKPQLEIYADDVKCAHGATIGQIDESSLFYLRSRGIDEDQARSLLTFAFLNDVLNEVHIEPLRTKLEEILVSQLVADQIDIDVDQE